MKHVRSHAYGLLIAALLLYVSASAHLADGTDNLLLTSTTHTPPRQIGITVRLDF